MNIDHTSVFQVIRPCVNVVHIEYCKHILSLSQFLLFMTEK